MAEKQPSLSNDSNKKLKGQRHIKILNTFPKSEQPENNTVYIEVLNHHTKGGHFPLFNPKSKILSCHLHEEINIAAKSWKFVNLNVSIKLPDLFVYTLSHITSFLASKGLTIVPINFRTGEIVRLIVEVHNISNQNLRIHMDTTFFEIRFMTHYNVELKEWSSSSTYSNKTKIDHPIQAEETGQVTII